MDRLVLRKPRGASGDTRERLGDVEEIRRGMGFRTKTLTRKPSENHADYNVRTKAYAHQVVSDTRVSIIFKARAYAILRGECVYARAVENKAKWEELRRYLDTADAQMSVAKAAMFKHPKKYTRAADKAEFFTDKVLWLIEDYEEEMLRLAHGYEKLYGARIAEEKRALKAF